MYTSWINISVVFIVLLRVHSADLPVPVLHGVRLCVNPFFPNAHFLYPLMFSGDRERMRWEGMA